MRIKVVFRVLGELTFFMGFLMIIPGVVSILYEEPTGVIAFALASFFTIGTGQIMRRYGQSGEVYNKEGFVIVTFAWLLAAIFGGAPFFFLGMDPVDAVFESMSGFTTTGATVLTDYDRAGYWVINSSQGNATDSVAGVLYGYVQSLQELMSPGQSASLKGGTNTSGYDLKNTTQNATLSLNGPEIASKETYFGLLFWRAFTQLLGGMGIVLLFVAIFPHLGVAGRQLYYAEATGPTKEPLTPKVRNTAKILWGIYLGFVGLETCLLMVAGMPLYDALCTSFTTLATGGFHPLAAGIVAYESPAIELIVVAFMFIGATSFVLHYRLIYNRDLECYAKDSEFRFYVLIMAAAVFIIALWGGVEGNLLHRIRLAGFHVVSVMTTTGFTNTFDYDHWSVAANMVLVLLMLIGGSVGSTAGAIKVGRVLLVLKYTHRELVEMLHPSAVRTIRMAGVVVQENVLISILFFTLLYLIVFFSSSLALAVVESSDKEFDLISAISAVATCMGGVGPGLGDVAFDFSRVTSFGKVIGIFCMYIGRMEILPVMLLFIPDLWRR